MRRIKQDLAPQPCPIRETKREAFWWWGPTGTGKTSKWINDYVKQGVKVYQKDLGPWFNGYQGEKVVVMEELSPEFVKGFAQSLKRWTEEWVNNPAPIKGSETYLSHDVFIVTSNFNLKDMPIQAADLEPLLRRFKVIEFKKLN